MGNKYTWIDLLLDMALATIAIAALVGFVLTMIGCATQHPGLDSITACEPQTELIVCVDEDFDSDSAAVFAAIDAWDEALRGVARLTPQSVSIVEATSLAGCDITIIRVDSSTPYVAIQPSWELAYTHNRSLIYVVADRRPDLRRLVLEHEIGHALGLGHTETGLMRPAHATAAAQISTTDAVWAAYYLGGKN